MLRFLVLPCKNSYRTRIKKNTLQNWHGLRADVCIAANIDHRLHGDKNVEQFCDLQAPNRLLSRSLTVAFGELYSRECVSEVSMRIPLLLCTTIWNLWFSFVLPDLCSCLRWLYTCSYDSNFASSVLSQCNTFLFNFTVQFSISNYSHFLLILCNQFTFTISTLNPTTQHVWNATHDDDADDQISSACSTSACDARSFSIWASMHGAYSTCASCPTNGFFSSTSSSNVGRPGASSSSASARHHWSCPSAPW